MKKTEEWNGQNSHVKNLEFKTNRKNKWSTLTWANQNKEFSKQQNCGRPKLKCEKPMGFQFVFAHLSFGPFFYFFLSFSTTLYLVVGL